MKKEDLRPAMREYMAESYAKFSRKKTYTLEDPIPEEYINLKIDQFKELHAVIADDIFYENMDLFPAIEKITIDSIYGWKEEEIQNIIFNYPNLKALEVKGMNLIKRLDISSLNKLQFLSVTHNPNLRIIEGIGKIANLRQLALYENDRFEQKEKIIDLYPYLLNMGVHCKFGVDWAPDLYRRDHDPSKSDFKKLIFAEESSRGASEELSFTSREILKMIEFMQEFEEKYIKPNETKFEILTDCYTWQLQNMVYDYDFVKKEELKETTSSDIYYSTSSMSLLRNRDEQEGKSKNKEKLFVICEGCVRSLRFMLSYFGIENHPVICLVDYKGESLPKTDIGKYRRSIIGNHIMIQVEVNGKNYFCDPTFDIAYSNNGQNVEYYLKGTNNITNDGRLIFSGYNLSEEDYKRSEINNYINYSKSKIITTDLNRSENSIRYYDEKSPLFEDLKNLYTRFDYEKTRQVEENLEQLENLFLPYSPSSNVEVLNIAKAQRLAYLVIKKDDYDNGGQMEKIEKAYLLKSLQTIDKYLDRELFDERPHAKYQDIIQLGKLINTAKDYMHQTIRNQPLNSLRNMTATLNDVKAYNEYEQNLYKQYDENSQKK